MSAELQKHMLRMKADGMSAQYDNDALEPYMDDLLNNTAMLTTQQRSFYFAAVATSADASTDVHTKRKVVADYSGTAKRQSVDRSSSPEEDPQMLE